MIHTSCLRQNANLRKGTRDRRHWEPRAPSRGTVIVDLRAAPDARSRCRRAHSRKCRSPLYKRRARTFRRGNLKAHAGFSPCNILSCLTIVGCSAARDDNRCIERISRLRARLGLAQLTHCGECDERTRRGGDNVEKHAVGYR